MKVDSVDMLKTIQNVLNNPSFCPCAFIGKYATEFKKVYQGRIFDVHGLEDIRTLVGNFSGLSDIGGGFFVIDGVGFLSPVGQNSLLKFIEESKFPLILLAYYDKISPIIMSRVKFSYKQPVFEVKNLQFVGLREALDFVESKRKSDPDYSEMDELKFYAESCPKAFVGKFSASDYGYGASKILRMVSRL